MHKELTQIFKNNEFGNIRVILVGAKQEPAFNLEDTCIALGYTRTAKGKVYVRKDRIEKIAQNFDISGLSTMDNFLEITKEADFNDIYIYEYALYDLAFESKAAGSRRFRNWVTSEVLPTIRKHGLYITDETYQEYLNDRPKFEARLGQAHEEILQLRADLEESDKANEILTAKYNDVRLMYQNCTNEVAEYVIYNLAYDKAGKINTTEVYNHYCRWCNNTAHYKAYDKRQFDELLLERMVAGHSIKKQGSYYLGVKLNKG